MPDLWLTSDLHLGHEMVARYRGYETAEEHDEALARRWDKVVREDAVVWVLGDVAMAGWRARLAWVAARPGVKHLVLGNHDRAHPLHSRAYDYQRAYLQAFDSVQTAARLSLGDQVGNVRASHFPYEGDRGAERFTDWRLRDAGRPLVHGHTHGPERLTRTSLGTPQVHVGLDAWGGTLAHRTEVAALLS
jgi:calcineurin-like phosphoesterase family protein